ncbi:cytochrome P450 [Oleomonas cavernae]|uniref:Cytochrome P450 n=1 Tax=Oleomonas cavernae TaxID=2320859 RepID=A0A418WSZ5_9PROT|nr:cytochrome P450 [Oleomonas cavernae]RJF94327.1 cytochrome P450 [Oleomonas cavernae]
MTTTDTRIPVDIGKVLVDPAAYADHRLHDTYRWLRANNPLGVAEIEGFDPFWVVTRHADLQEVGRQNELFPYGNRSSTMVDQFGDARVREIMGGSPQLLRTLVHMDAPDHPKYRALTQGWFMPASLRKLEDKIRGIARAAVDRLAGMGGRCDFVADFALGYPLHVVMEILGVPEQDEPRMLKLTQEIFGPQDPDTARAALSDPGAFVLSMMAVVEDFSAYFGAISADRRANPRDDLASVIANAQVDGEPISDQAAMSYYIIVATAGHDTTSSSTAGGMWALCENPDQWAKLKADPSLIPTFVDEAIRWTTPVKHFMRSAAADTELAGRKIAQGDWLMLCYASGNRDEAVFENPYSFQVDRKPNKHIAFGYGAHLCLGQHLAKMEMRILFEELLPRLKSVAFDGEPTMSQSWFVNGPKKLPLRFELA